jgi:hypothetical protein
MLTRLVSLAVAFALGVTAPLLASRDEVRPRETVRQLAIEAPREAGPEEVEAWRALARPKDAEAYDEGRVDQVRWLAPQARFPGARIIDGSFTHRPACEAERRDLRVLAFTVAGGPTATLTLVNAEPRDVSVLRGEGDDALIVLQGRNGRGDPGLELVAWELARGRIDDDVATWRGPSLGWSFDGVLRVHGRRLDLHALTERTGISIVMD